MQTIDAAHDLLPAHENEPGEVAPAKGEGNYAAVRFNAMKHGVLSRHVVLPHEDRSEFDDLLAALVMEHKPGGATELHLVEELAGILWRKRRVLMAEGASINQGLKGAARNAEGVIPAAAPFEMGLSGKGTDLRDLLDMTPEEVVERQRDAKHDLEATRKAASILRRGGANAYEKALRALLPDSREWWQNYVEDEEYQPTAEGLEQFIREHLEPLCIGIEKEARHHDAIKAQTLGEGLQAYRLEKLNRYETHLDRKFERTLAMLLKLKELRGAGNRTG
jgi:hypothetical protein